MARSAEMRGKQRPEPISGPSSAAKKQHPLPSAPGPISPNAADVGDAQNIQPTCLAGGCAVAKKTLALLETTCPAQQSTLGNIRSACVEKLSPNRHTSQTSGRLRTGDQNDPPAACEQTSGIADPLWDRIKLFALPNRSLSKKPTTNFTLTLFENLSTGSTQWHVGRTQWQQFRRVAFFRP